MFGLFYAFMSEDISKSGVSESSGHTKNEDKIRQKAKLKQISTQNMKTNIQRRKNANQTVQTKQTTGAQQS